MRPIKFRVWDRLLRRMMYYNLEDILRQAPSPTSRFGEIVQENIDHCKMQFTGLLDRQDGILTEIYEGDIIDANGRVKGNIYESPQVFQEGVDCLIEGMGTAAWRNTESIAMGRGCHYAK